MPTTDTAKTEKKPQPVWLVYIALFLAGMMFLIELFGYTPLQKISIRLGTALIYSAFALFVGKGKPVGYIAAVIVVLAVVGSFLI